MRDPRDPLGLDGPDGGIREPGPWGDQNRLPPIVRVAPWSGWFPGSLPFDANSAALVTLTGAGPPLVVVSYVVPQNFNATLNAWGGEFTECDGYTDTSWTLRRNGSTILTLPATGQLFGVTQDLLSSVRLQLQGGDTVEVWAAPGATTRTGRARLVGFTWPALAAERM